MSSRCASDRKSRSWVCAGTPSTEGKRTAGGAARTGQALTHRGRTFPKRFVRDKLLDAIGDLALCGLPIYGRFRSYKGGHALNALVLQGLFASEANYEIVTAEELPLAFDALDDVLDGLEVRPYLRSVG